MAERRHTPGPWMVLKQGRDDEWLVVQVASPRFNVSRIDQAITYLMDFDERAEPDARLIAAAPDLLEALKDLLTFDLVERAAFRSKPEGAPNSTVRIAQDKLIALEDRARAAIAKAEGRS